MMKVNLFVMLLFAQLHASERHVQVQSCSFSGRLAVLSVFSTAEERPPLADEESPHFQGEVLHTAFFPEEDSEPESEQPCSAYVYHDEVCIPSDQEMDFPESGVKTSKDGSSAIWQSKVGKTEMTISVDNVDPDYEWKSEVRKNGSKENREKKKHRRASSFDEEKSKDKENRSPSAQISVKWSN
jgi:hypothetical protein